VPVIPAGKRGRPIVFGSDEKEAIERTARGRNLLTYVKFKFIDLGDLLEKELELACPVTTGRH